MGGLAKRSKLDSRAQPMKLRETRRIRLISGNNHYKSKGRAAKGRPKGKGRELEFEGFLVIFDVLFVFRSEVLDQGF